MANTQSFMDDIGDDEQEVAVAKYDISSSPNDFNMLTLISFLDSGAIVIPHYQRNFTWDKKRASKLVESLIIGLPVPQIFLYEQKKNEFAVLDGQQRLMSIYFFVKKRFPKREARAELREILSTEGFYPQNVLSNDKYFTDFNLMLPAPAEGKQSPYHELNYDTLDEYRRDFDLRTIRCVIIKQTDPNPETDDHSSVYEIFDRLNTGGVNLKPQEIRSNIYYSPFYEQLYILNKSPAWRKFIQQPDRDLNLRDIELILRLMAMLVYSSKYSPSMTNFLNRFSAHAKSKFTLDDIKFLGAAFNKFVDGLDDGEMSAFRPNERFSIGLAESVFFAAFKDAWDKRDLTLAKNFDAQLVTKVAGDIRDYLFQGSSKTENVKQRLSKAAAALQ